MARAEANNVGRMHHSLYTGFRVYRPSFFWIVAMVICGVVGGVMARWTNCPDIADVTVAIFGLRCKDVSP